MASLVQLSFGTGVCQDAERTEHALAHDLFHCRRNVSVLNVRPGLVNSHACFLQEAKHEVARLPAEHKSWQQSDWYRRGNRACVDDSARCQTVRDPLGFCHHCVLGILRTSQANGRWKGPPSASLLFGVIFRPLVTAALQGSR